MDNNRHIQSIPAKDLDQLRDLIQQAARLIAPHAIALTPEEKQGLLKMGPKSLAFVERAHEFAQSNAALRPAFLDMEEFDADFADAHNLWDIQNSINQLADAVSAIVTVAGSEAYQQALIFHGNVKFAAASTPGAQTIYKELSALLPLGKRRAAAPKAQ
ncbi:MAG: hypothetical protein LBF50_11075 [Azoarcus sp.]|jgi:hypothetical protein|nr:hypothetical protein [Azoarcus sp.]